MWVCGLDWSGPGQGQVADAFECGNEPLGSIKCGSFLEQQQTSYLLKKDSATWSKYKVGILSLNIIISAQIMSFSSFKGSAIFT